MPALWNSGLFDVCAEPGGAVLCLKATCCHCIVLGEINEHINTFPMGFLGGCFGPILGEFVIPCSDVYAEMMMAMDVQKLEGNNEEFLNAWGYSFCCRCCYAEQIWRQIDSQKQRGITRRPGQRLVPQQQAMQQPQQGTVIGVVQPQVVQATVVNNNVA